MAMIMKVSLNMQTILGQSLGFARLPLLPSFGLLLATCLFGTIIHELGHYGAGKFCHQACLRFVIGPLEFAPSGGRWRLQWVSLRHAGMVGLVPSTFERFRFQRVLCAAGGPLASFLVGIIFLYLSMRASSQMEFWIWSFSVQWALVGTLALIPVRFAGARSDGFSLWEALRGGRALEWTERDLLTPSSHATAMRVGEWPHELVVRLADSAADPVNRRFHQYLAYIHFLDRGDLASSGLHLEQLAEQWVPGDPAEYALEAAYFYGFHRNDQLEARKWLEIEKKDAEPWVRLRARAAVERVEGNREQARMLIEAGLSGLQGAEPCGAYQYEIDRLYEMLISLDRRT
jgi:hypothetical protein